MNVEFSNAYQEVLLENLDVILKQNFMMQTRLKLLEKEANVRAEMQAKIDELTVKNQEVLQQVEQTQHYRVQAESNDAIVQEKSRIQSALNDTMRELGVTKNLLDLKISLDDFANAVKFLSFGFAKNKGKEQGAAAGGGGMPGMM